jgi:hypothetical protein
MSNDAPPKTPAHAGGIGRIPEAKTLGLGKTALAETHSRWSTFTNVAAQLERKGVGSELEEPGFACPQVTEEDLLTEDARHFTRIYHHVLAWFEYVTTIYARTRAQLLQYENELEVVAAARRKKLREENKSVPKADRMSAKEIEDEVLTDIDYQRVMLDAQQLRQSKIIVEAVVENLDRSLKVISRQVEIKRQERESSRTGSNFNYRGGPVPSGYSQHQREKEEEDR